MRHRLLTLMLCCAPVALHAQQVSTPMTAQQLLDQPDAVRFEAVERYHAATQGTGPIALRLGTTSTLRVVPTDGLVLPLILDPTGAAGATVAALSATIRWDAQRLVLDSIAPGPFGTVQANTASAPTGMATVSTFSATGTATAVTVATLHFHASGAPGGTAVAIVPTQIGDALGTSLLRQVVTRPVSACVVPPGNWGDVNDDGQVNIIDAQQIARRAIALPVLRPAVVTAQGDVNADSSVDIIDAQQVARASIGLSAPPRIGTPAFVIPPVFAVQVSALPNPLGLGEMFPLVASPRSSAGLPLDGCVPVTWTSSMPAIASVDTTGLVSGVDVGSATISASAGGTTGTASVTTINRATVVTGFSVVDGPDIATYPGVQTGQPIRIKVTNAFGTGVAAVPITVTPTAGAVLVGDVTNTRLIGAKFAPLTVTTDATGTAIFRLWGGTSAPTDGQVTISTPGQPSTVVTVTTISPRKGEHVCMYDGWSLRCWGDNSRGQLGNGGATSSLTPVPVALGPVTLGATSSVSAEGFGDHTCLTDVNGDAYCWGSNTAGQIGDSSYTNRPGPTRVRTSLKFTKVVTGGEHSCGLTVGGEIWCWGYNWAGQLGDGTFSNRRSIPVRTAAPAGVTFVDLSAGTNHSCGGTAAGTWYCWGLNTEGQLGDGTTLSAPTPVAVGGNQAFSQVVGGEAHSCGRTAAGLAFCWGDPDAGALGDGRVAETRSQLTPVAVTNGEGFTALSAGNYRTCGGKADGTVWCWGWNNGGQLGEGTRMSRGVPTLIPFTGAGLRLSGTQMESSGQTTCGLTPASQQLFCWGSNLSGKLGTGSNPNSPIPTPQLIPRTGAPVGAASAITPTVLDGGVSTLPTGVASPSGWEVRVRDALGAPVVNTAVTFAVVSGGLRFGTADTTITALTDTAGIARTGPLSTGSTLGLIRLRASVPAQTPSGQSGLARFIIVGRIVPNGGTLVKLTGDSVFVTTVNLRNRVPITLRVDAPDGTPVPYAQVRVSTLSPSDGTLGGGGSLTIEADAGGIVRLDASHWTLGTQSANGITVQYDGATAVTFTRFVNPTPAFPATSCELSTAGTAYCWGASITATQSATQGVSAVTTPTAVGGGLTFTQLAGGIAAHKCGLVGTTAYCWGPNDAGQLGDSSRTDRAAPTLVAGGLAFTQIATGGHTTCALTATGALYCWGWSGTAGFGIGDALRGRAVSSPVAIATPVPFAKISVADDAVCGLSGSGDLWCRGDGLFGWNLDGTTTQRTTFTKADGGPWADANAGYLSVCAIAQADGRVSCGGYEQYSVGALGTTVPVNGTQPRLAPVASTTAYASVAVFPFAGCARTTTGETDCWGNNAYGQTGTGSSDPVYTPKRIDGIQFAALRPVGFRTVCGKVASGFLYCWGQNGVGQLGVGTTSNIANSIPLAVFAWPDGPATGTAVSLSATSAVVSAAVAGTTVSPSPAVLVRDRSGVGAAGVVVSFTLVTGDGTLSGATVTTDANGRASLGALTMGTTPGVLHVVRASAPGLPSVFFRFTTIPAAASLVATSNTTQYVSDWESNSRHPLWVLARDANNQPIANYPVTYAPTPGSGTVAGTTSAVAWTNAAGIASLQTWSTPTGVAGTYTLTATAGALPAVTFTMVKLLNYGGRTTCRIKYSAAYCWGDNTRGEAGTGGTAAQSTPAVVTGGLSFIALADGGRSYHQCGLTTSGAAYCWGDNTAGELGNGTRTASRTPVAVAGGLTFSALFKGVSSTCGLTQPAGQLYCWGWMSHSRLGDASVADIRTVPTLVNTNGLTFTAVALAQDGTCGLTATGGVHCWSNTNASILGDGGPTRAIPSVTPIPNLTATQISASDRAFCVTTTNGQIRCWGNDNSYGQLGTGTTLAVSTPTSVVGLPAGVVMREVRFSSWTSTCGISTTGRMFCWGYNAGGQLGNGTTVNSITPVEIGVGIAFSAFHPVGTDSRFCATATSGNSYCWGVGPLGDGTFTQSLVPIQIVLP